MEIVKENKNSQSKPKSLGKESFFSQAPIQTKLKVNQPGDKYEVEADLMAEQVVQKLTDSDSTSSGNNSSNQNAENNLNIKPSIQSEVSPPGTHNLSLIQTKCDACEAEEKDKPKEEEIQKKHESHIFLQADGDEEESTLMAKRQTSDSNPVSTHTTAQLFASKGGGEPLPKNTHPFFWGFEIPFPKNSTLLWFFATHHQSSLLSVLLGLLKNSTPLPGCVKIVRQTLPSPYGKPTRLPGLLI